MEQSKLMAKLAYKALDDKLKNDYKELERIFDVLYEATDFGASLENMYEQSAQISKNSYDYQIYEELLKYLSSTFSLHQRLLLSMISKDEFYNLIEDLKSSIGTIFESYSI